MRSVERVKQIVRDYYEYSYGYTFNSVNEETSLESFVEVNVFRF